MTHVHDVAKVPTWREVFRQTAENFWLGSWTTRPTPVSSLGNDRAYQTGMNLPFSPDQFFEVFATYNRTLWPAVIVLWLYALLAAAMLARSKRAGRFVGVMLTVQWAWTAVAYHVLFFSRINPAAWLFAGMFVAQSAIFAWFGIIRDELRFSARGSARHVTAWVMIAYALAYPFVVQADAREFFHSPWFGVPCPTTLMTIGFLLAADAPWSPLVALIPIVWAIIAGSAALSLGVRADLMLWVAAMALAGYALWMFLQRFSRSVVRRGWRRTHQ